METATSVHKPTTVTFAEGIHPGDSFTMPPQNTADLTATSQPAPPETQPVGFPTESNINNNNSSFVQPYYRGTPPVNAPPHDFALLSRKADGPGTFQETQKVFDISYQGNTGPNMGIHTTGFRRGKYNPSEWHEANYGKYYQSFVDRDAAGRIRHESRRTIDEIAETSNRPQLESTKKLQERIHDINFWKHELEREIVDLRTETETLVEQKRRVENALRATEIPLHIANDNLNCRRRRQGIDLVQDNVELGLLKEVETINNVQDLLRRTIEQAEAQIKASRAAKQCLEMDWSDKVEADEYDTKAANLRNHHVNKQHYAGSATFQQVQSTPESWAQHSHDNILNAEHERMASIQLRTLIDNVLEDTSRDMLEQKNAVNCAFTKRLEEVDDAKAKLEENLKKVSQRVDDAKAKLEENLKKIVDDIARQEKCIADLKEALHAKDDNMKVAQTRLYLHSQRPNVELCRDDAQYHLIGEVNEIAAGVDKTMQQLNIAQNNLKDLQDDRMQLEREISNKKNTIFIDRQKCLTVRNRYPSTLRLQGFNRD